MSITFLSLKKRSFWFSRLVHRSIVSQRSRSGVHVVKCKLRMMREFKHNENWAYISRTDVSDASTLYLHQRSFTGFTASFFLSVNCISRQRFNSTFVVSHRKDDCRDTKKDQGLKMTAKITNVIHDFFHIICVLLIIWHLKSSCETVEIQRRRFVEMLRAKNLVEKHMMMVFQWAFMVLW